MIQAAVSADEVAHWRGWIGRCVEQTEVLDQQSARRYAAALEESFDSASDAPPLLHWAFFLPTPLAHDLGEDGHPKRGGFMPPITLPRRMFAAAEINWLAPLRIGVAATLKATIADVKHKSGKSGDLVFVEVDREISQAETVCVREHQAIAYRAGGARTAAVAETYTESDATEWRPSAVDLFRFSATTFNSHRIHYDWPYARDAEGYPGLVVQGPFIAARLCGLARSLAGRDLSRFSFRAQAPAFSPQPLYLTGSLASSEVRAVRCDGITAMAATFSTRG